MSADEVTFATTYYPFTSVEQSEHPYPHEVDEIRRQSFPTHDAICVHPDGKYLIVAHHRDTTVGYALVDDPHRWNDNEPLYVYLDELAVDEPHRHRGIGEALLCEVGRLVRDEMDGCDAVPDSDPPR